MEIGTEWDHPVFSGQDPTVDPYLFVVFQCLFQFERFGDSDRIVAATLVGGWFEGGIFIFFRE